MSKLNNTYHSNSRGGEFVDSGSLLGLVEDGIDDYLVTFFPRDAL